jgi:prepilin-type N-terminal cleavage/methylation domain-containing protein
MFLGDEGKQMRKQKGFSLIELLIVVAIILIIAAIAIPNLLRARIAANESSAAASVRTIATGELTYQTAYQNYSPDLVSLGPPAATGCPSSGPVSGSACIIDYQLATAANAATAKSGFFFGAASTAGSLQYLITATPASQGSSGVKGFCAIEDNVVRFINPSTGVVASRTACLALNAIGN